MYIKGSNISFIKAALPPLKKTYIVQSCSGNSLFDHTTRKHVLDVRTICIRNGSREKCDID